MDRDIFVKQAYLNDCLKLLLTDRQTISTTWANDEVDEVQAPSSSPGSHAHEEETKAYDEYQRNVEHSKSQGDRLRGDVERALGPVDDCRGKLVSYFQYVTPNDGQWSGREWYFLESSNESTREKCLEGIWDSFLKDDSGFASELEDAAGDIDKMVRWIEALGQKASQKLADAMASGGPAS